MTPSEPAPSNVVAFPDGEVLRLQLVASALLEALKDTLRMLQAAHMQCGIHHAGNPRVIKAREAVALAEASVQALKAGSQ